MKMFRYNRFAKWFTNLALELLLRARSARQVGLTSAVISGVLVGLTLTALFYVLSTRYLIASQWPWDLEPQAANVQRDTMRLVFAFVAGIGGVVALVVSYRKQANSESRVFTEEFTTAAQLMASTEIAESIAGAHAMAAAINGTKRQARRKQGVDQLCGYLRLATDSKRDPDLNETTVTRHLPDGSQTNGRYSFKTREPDMRRAVIAIIADHCHKPTWESRRRDHWRDQILNLSGSDLTRAYLGYAYLASADLTRTDLTHADLTHADLKGADLTHADLTHADLKGADLTLADLTHADLTHADLRGVTLNDADLTEADLIFATLPDATLRRAILTQADLTGATLARADLTGATLYYATLCGADLTEADLTGAILVSSDLTEADLTGITYNEDTEWPSGFLPPSSSHRSS